MTATILIVEDERLVAAEIAAALDRFGFAVSGTAVSADDAITCATACCPDLVLMDINIEGELDGIATAQILRERFGVPVVYLTHSTDDLTIKRARLSRPYGYLIKPLDVRELKSTLEIALYRHRIDRELERRVGASAPAPSPNIRPDEERLASLAVLAGGVAHEINNPLCYATGFLHLAAERLGELGASRPGLAAEAGEVRSLIELALGGAERIARIVADLMVFSRTDPRSLRPIDADAAIHAALARSGPALRARARVVKEVEQVPPVQGDPWRLEQTFAALLDNCAEALADGGAARHQVRIVLRRDGDDAIAEVIDTGPGMTAEVARRAVEPFFSTRELLGESARARGLGLAICHGVVRSFGGDLELDTEVGRGTTVRLRLPLARRAAGEAAEAPTGRRGAVLVIDDDEMVARTVALTLEEEHDVEVCTDPRAAVERVRGGRRYDVVLCDLMMPDLDGRRVHAELTAIDPDLDARFVVMTGGALSSESETFLAAMAPRRIAKPFDLPVLRSQVRKIVDRG